MKSNFDRCLENITRNLPVNCNSYKDHSGMKILFVDVHTGSHCGFSKTEIENSKDYRQIRTLVRARLKDALRSMKHLAEESLEILDRG